MGSEKGLPYFSPQFNLLLVAENNPIKSFFDQHLECLIMNMARTSGSTHRDGARLPGFLSFVNETLLLILTIKTILAPVVTKITSGYPRWVTFGPEMHHFERGISILDYFHAHFSSPFPLNSMTEDVIFFIPGPVNTMNLNTKRMTMEAN